MERRYPVFVAIGLIGGLLSGLFGVGGGIVMVPLLVSFGGFDQRRASAVSLLAILPAALVGSATYLLNGEADVLAAITIAVGSVTGSILGTALLARIPLQVIQWLFIVLVIATGIRMLFVEPSRGEPASYSVSTAIAYVLIGVLMGLSSGLFGIGGGVIAAPALVAVVGMSDLVAKGTALLAMVPTSVTGTVVNRRKRLVDIRAGVIVGVAAAVASVPGAYLALAMAPRLSAVLFAALMFALAAQLIVRALRGDPASNQPEG